MKHDIRARFAALAAAPDEDIQLDEAALLIAAEAEPGLSVGEYLDKLDRLASGYREDPRFNAGRPVTSLISYIHEHLGFSGNLADYYDPGNSYLNRVIDLKTGIPISLALIHIAMGARLAVPVAGVSFPGHFLVRYGDDRIVDPFSGRELSRPDCLNLLRQVAGARANLRDEYFYPAGPRDLLVRMLDNLKQIFWRGRQWDASKSCIERQLLLLPERDEFNVQLGAVHEMQGNRALAQHTYVRVLQGATDEQVRQLASQRLLALEGGAGTIH